LILWDEFVSTFDVKGELIHIIQCRVARISVGPSTVRGRGNTGVAKAARAYLRSIDLSRFGTTDECEFQTALNEETEALRRAFPEGARRWGLARKVLNIFLRDCAYTIYLAKEFNLSLAEDYFEIPLDSITAKELRKTKSGRTLPRWLGVIHLHPRLSQQYQSAARKEAKMQGVSRMHLDALWWSFSRDNDED